ncbi:MAG: hypothetical protein NWQ82_01150 [Solirubrobacteraceae bacterium]|jgi:hypothetical protein|nr:hypothetical protein [Solirubrobacteraceae bacterium]MDP4672922.1 hypothetical protein [Solirubrobacteraceae bacterium]MDP4920558.1 hypothetical protein [Solirubrobacteraceae bacterium]
MRSRGILILLATSVVLLSGLSSLRSSTEKRNAKESAPATETASAKVPAATLDEASAVMPTDSKVKIKVGQRLKLEVRATTPDVAQIEGLGLSFPVEPDLPSGIMLVAPTTGSFDVALEISGRKVGTIIVSD